MMISNTPLRHNILSHTRSSSLPASRSHPLIPQFNQHLHNLNSSSSSSSSSSTTTLSSITNDLHFLDHLYNCVDDLLLLPHTHQVFARESNEKWVEQVLDGYLGLVDACATAKDFVFNAKEFVLEFLVVLRRRRGGDLDAAAAANSRKTTKKIIHKSLRKISSLKNKPSVSALDKEQETIAIISMLKETESATLQVIESLLLAISGTKRWSLVSKLRKISGQHQKDDDVVAEFRELDAKIVSLGTSSVQMDEVQQLLRDMEARIEVVEERVEQLLKRLIKTRVSLLNMHSQ